MVVGSARLELRLDACRSLKDKRQIVRSLLERLRHRYNAAAAEVGAHEQWNQAVIGLACVSNDAAHAREMIEEIVRFVEGDGRCEMIDIKMEMGHY